MNANNRQSLVHTSSRSISHQVSSEGRSQISSNVWSHTPLHPRAEQADTQEQARDLSSQVGGRGRGAPARTRAGVQGGKEVGCGGGSGRGGSDPPSPHPLGRFEARRGGATHTLYGSRGSDVSVILKETFDLRKRAGER